MFSLAVVVGLLLLVVRVGSRRFRGRNGAIVQVVHRQRWRARSTVTVVRSAPASWSSAPPSSRSRCSPSSTPTRSSLADDLGTDGLDGDSDDEGTVADARPARALRVAPQPRPARPLRAAPSRPLAPSAVTPPFPSPPPAPWPAPCSPPTPGARPWPPLRGGSRDPGPLPSRAGRSPGRGVARADGRDGRRRGADPLPSPTAPTSSATTTTTPGSQRELQDRTARRARAAPQRRHRLGRHRRPHRQAQHLDDRDPRDHRALGRAVGAAACTSFTKIIVVLGLTRNALGLPASPPNQVLTGLALFLTLFVMGPVLGEINDVGRPALPRRRRCPTRRPTTPASCRCATSCSATPATTSWS